MRLSGRAFVVIAAALGLLIVFSTNQILPATSPYQAQMRVWLAARATGITAYLLLTAQVFLGLILSHPVNQSTWKLSKRLFPWHENLLVFLIAFLARSCRRHRGRPVRRGRTAGGVHSRPVELSERARRARDALPVRPPRHRPHGSLHEGPATGRVAHHPSVERGRLRARLDARDAGRHRQRARCFRCMSGQERSSSSPPPTATGSASADGPPSRRACPGRPAVAPAGGPNAITPRTEGLPR